VHKLAQWWQKVQDRQARRQAKRSKRTLDAFVASNWFDFDCVFPKLVSKVCLCYIYDRHGDVNPENQKIPDAELKIINNNYYLQLYHLARDVDVAIRSGQSFDMQGPKYLKLVDEFATALKSGYFWD
jgi:hypothetical protein